MTLMLAGHQAMVKERLTQRTRWTAEERHLRLTSLCSHAQIPVSLQAYTPVGVPASRVCIVVASQELVEKGLCCGGQLGLCGLHELMTQRVLAPQASCQSVVLVIAETAFCKQL